MPEHQHQHGLTVREVAARFRVGKTRIHEWIRSGQLSAINTAPIRSSRPRWVILPDALAAFERGRQGGAPAPQPQRRRRPAVKDYFPD